MGRDGEPKEYKEGGLGEDFEGFTSEEKDDVGGKRSVVDKGEAERLKEKVEGEGVGEGEERDKVPDEERGADCATSKEKLSEGD